MRAASQLIRSTFGWSTCVTLAQGGVGLLIVVALAITCLLAALAMSIACAIMYVTPDYWSAWVEKENRFWVRKGLLSPASAERLARFEQSDYLKIIYLVGAPLCALAGAVALFLVL